MPTPHAPTVSLDAATPADATLLGDLLELYAQELSDAFPDVVRGPDGRFGYPRLPLYWSGPTGGSRSSSARTVRWPASR
jgi:hypothetical protein